jgi:CheY-like chemotaxis protein
VVFTNVQAVRRIRRFGCAVAVVALTGNAMDADAQDMLAAGCDLVLKKPTSRDELRSCLAAQLGRCGALLPLPL